MLGTVGVIERGDVRIHTYTAPEQGWVVNTHIIELTSQLLAIDAQYTLDFAKEVVDYAAALNKPITRLYVTHYHPDHLLGAAAFSAPIFGLPAVAQKIEQVGDRVAREEHEKCGASIPDHAQRISELVLDEEETIDGTVLRFLELPNAETESALMIALPEHGILITQDLLYHQVHVFVGERAFDSWRSALNTYSQAGFETFLPGHGRPGGPELFAAMTSYLEAAERAWKTSPDPDSFARTMIDLFPHHAGRVLSQHEGRFLYKS